MPDSLSSTALLEFLKVAERLSFTKAAGALGLHPSVLTRRIQRLEQDLGVRLLERDARRVVLTDAGLLLRERALDIQARLNETAQEVAAHAARPAGTLSLTMPSLFGQRHIAPLLPDLLAQQPGLRLRLSFTDQFQDLAQSGFDAAVRTGALEAGGNLVARKLAANRRVLCASPAYLARCGKPAHPAELVAHRTLYFPVNATRPVWQLRGPGGAVEATINPVLIADNMEALRHAALAGMGITVLATFVAGDDLRAGRLVPVFADYVPRDSTISVVYRNAPHLPRKVRVLVDFLVKAFRGTPPWDAATAPRRR